MTIVFYRRCTSVHDAGECKFHEGGRVYTATVERCNCRAFQYNGSCKHVAQVREDVCLWDERDGLIMVNPTDRTHCPACGALTAVYPVEEEES